MTNRFNPPSTAASQGSRPGVADHWKPENPCFAQVADALRWRLERAKSRVETDFAPDSVAYTNIEHTTAQVFLGAAPHTDLDFDRWFVMMVLQAAPDAILHTSHHIKVPKDKPLESVQDVPMRAGEVFVFDAHRIHWVKPSVDVGLPTPAWRDESCELWEKYFDQATVIIGTELRSRPTREVAEKRLLEFFSQYTPESWERATRLSRKPLPGHEAPTIKVKL